MRVDRDELSIGDGRKWTLVDDSHPIFNRWEHVTNSGESYCECFYKYEDPNRYNVLFSDNPYLKRMQDMGVLKKDLAAALCVSANELNSKLYGEPGYGSFTEGELGVLNKKLGFEEYGSQDVRVIINPELWGAN